LLHVKDDDGLRDATKFKIQKIIETKPKELLGGDQPIIMDIVNACQDVLEDAAEAKAAGRELPSLEEERAIHEAAAAKLAEQLKKEEERQKQLEDEESQRMLGSLVQDELRRQKARTKETKLKNKMPTASPIANKKANLLSVIESLEFDQPISLDIEGSDEPVIFQSVSNKVLIRRGPVSKAFTVRPDVGNEEAPLLVLKQTDLDTKPTDHILFKKQLQALETELDALKKIRHQNILDLLDFKVHKTILQGGHESDSSWTVSVLTEFAEKGSLEEFLDIAGSLGVNKVRSWTIELLDGLRYLHEHGILHEDVNAGNVLLVRESSGEVRPKLADAGYQRKLHSLVSKKQPTDTVSVAKSAYWLPPEIANMDQPYSQKTDVWDFGIMFLQMIFGLTVIQKYSSPMSLADSLTLSESLNEFVHKLFKADPKKRPRAFELSSSEFLATDAPVLDEDSSAPASRFGSITSLMIPTPRRQRHDSMNNSGVFSRYKEDFVEEGRLGKGGFGEVVKARKKLDGQIYAIKKITQKSSASLTEVLKEVRLLSQLSHPSVVRKFISFCLAAAISHNIYQNMFYQMESELLLFGETPFAEL
jgi:translation initiation factor 2-alpha kinase 4